MTEYFGTDGIRGRADAPPVAPPWSETIGFAIGSVCTTEENRHVIIGRDTRISGVTIETALTKGLNTAGAETSLAGVLPTPALAWLAGKHRAACAIVISASHNPYSDNGIKIFSGSGSKITDEQESAIEKIIDEYKDQPPSKPGHSAPNPVAMKQASSGYIEFCRSTAGSNSSLSGFSVVLDCANGAAFECAPNLFSALGAKVTAIANHPDGLNINENCGSQHTANLSGTVLETGADLGLAFDGDADRLIAVDGHGRELNGDFIIFLLALYLQKKKSLKDNLVVITPMSNLGLKKALSKHDIRTIEADVGDRHVLELMQKTEASLGGEQSGHIIIPSLHTTGDGLITALQLMLAIKETGHTLHQMAEELTIYPQTLINIDVKNKIPLDSIPHFTGKMKSLESELKGDGRIFVRYSGTQPMCRVMVEAGSKSSADFIAETLAEIIRNSTC